MGYSKILVGYDCSDASNRALADAYELVDHGLAEGVIVVTVTDLAKTGDPAFNAAARAAGVLLTSIGDEEEALSNLKKNVGDRVVGHEDVTTLRVAFGKPHELIISIAKAEGCGTSSWEAAAWVLSARCWAAFRRRSFASRRFPFL